jgi:hypothetical protein
MTTPSRQELSVARELISDHSPMSVVRIGRNDHYPFWMKFIAFTTALTLGWYAQPADTERFYLSSEVEDEIIETIVRIGGQVFPNNPVSRARRARAVKEGALLLVSIEAVEDFWDETSQESREAYDLTVSVIAELRHHTDQQLEGPIFYELVSYTHEFSPYTTDEEKVAAVRAPVLKLLTDATEQLMKGIANAELLQVVE